ncbi:Clp protease, partial [Acinetobacter baumannii]
CGGLSLLLQDHAWLKLYPVGMSLGALGIFAFTLLKPPSMIERFARLVEPDLPPSGVHWTRQVTKVWCVFFLCNALIAFITVFFT